MSKQLFVILFVICLGTLSATDVSGDQFGFWTLANSPYNMIGDVTVPAEVSLHIEPGVTVYIMGNYRITALGQLYAAGSLGDSIRFVSGQADPNALWKGIRLESTTWGSQIGFCYIEKAEYGVNSINSPALIHHNRFYENQKGMQLYGIGATDPAEVIVSHNLIERSIQNGILIVQNSNAVILANELRYNGTGTQYMAAIQLSNQSTGGSNSPIINDNHIHHNYKQGITAWDIYSVNAIQPEIYDNLIEYNLTGIYLLNSSGYVHNNIIRHNFIDGEMNSGAGVMVAGATSQPYFELNQIYGNYTGFYLGTNAQPCLGNMSIYHAWAQGENQIYDNIDATGALHSVYCYSYTNPNLVIMAENNYWGTNSALEILIGIQDQNDDPALCTVDFEPFLNGTMETSIIGSSTYTGIHTLVNPQIQFVSASTGDVHYEYPLTLGQAFNYSVPLADSFYVVITAEATDADLTVYGNPGGLLQPTVFYPGDFAPVDVGNILVTDLQPPRYQKIGTPEVFASHTIYPVYNNLFIYHWDYINWLYQFGDYLYIKRHTRYNDLANTTFNFPDGTVWDRNFNVAYNDTWTRTEIIDDNGTQRLSNFLVKAVTDETIIIDKNGSKDFYLLYLQREAVTDSLMAIRAIGSEQRKLFHYSGNYVYRAENIIPYINGAYLTEGNSWDFIPSEPVYGPTYLTYDNVEHFETNHPAITLYWQAPADDGVHTWTQYIIYDHDQPFDTVPFGQNWWHTDYQVQSTYLFTVAATDGVDCSSLTNSVFVTSVDIDDPAAIPLLLEVYPNPVTQFADNGALIYLNSGKELSGEITIHNLRGQVVRSIPVLATGAFSCRWDLKDEQGSPCASGIYFVRAAITGEKTQTRRLFLIK